VITALEPDAETPVVDHATRWSVSAIQEARCVAAPEAPPLGGPPAGGEVPTANRGDGVGTEAPPSHPVPLAHVRERRFVDLPRERLGCPNPTTRSDNRTY